MAARQATVAMTVVCVVAASAAAAVAATAAGCKYNDKANHDVPHIILALVPEALICGLLGVLLLQSFGKLDQLLGFNLESIQKLSVLVLSVTHRSVDEPFSRADIIDCGLAVVVLKGSE